MRLIICTFVSFTLILVSGCATTSGSKKSYKERKVVTRTAIKQVDGQEAGADWKKYVGADWQKNVNKAVSYLNSGKTETAKKILVANLMRYPESHVTLRTLATANLLQGDAEKATYFLKRAIGLNPKDAESYNLLGIIALRDGNKREAKESFEYALKLDDSNLAATANLAVMEQDLKNWKRALSLWQVYSARYPKDGYAIASKAVVQHALGNFKEAETLYNMVRKNPEYYNTLQYNMGVLYLDGLKNPKTALKVFENLDKSRMPASSSEEWRKNLKQLKKKAKDRIKLDLSTK
jgi:Flp pilus assembly protein TadD